MVNFYFIDTNIIIGYCNPFDRLSQVSKDFFNDIQNPRTIFLLFSVHEEFKKKIRAITSGFYATIVPLFKTTNDVDIIEENWSRTYERNFDKYIFNSIKSSLRGTKSMSKKDVFVALQKFIKTMNRHFDELTRYWIRRPRVQKRAFVLNAPKYKEYLKTMNLHAHPPDSMHLAMAAFFVYSRNLGKPDHAYAFYTDDNVWINEKLEEKIGLSNLKIKKMNYSEDTSLGYDLDTKCFNKKIVVLTYKPENL